MTHALCTFSSRLALFAGLSLLFACASFPRLASSARRVERELLPPDACELRLFARQEHTERIGMAKDVPAQRVGAALVERVQENGETTVREGVCIKKRGKELSIPQPIAVAAVALESRFCAGSIGRAKAQGWLAASSHATEPVAVSDVQVCRWNGFFHAARPFSFTLVASAGSVSSYVQLARVYRNGDPVYTWNGSADDISTKLTVEGASLLADGGMLSRSLPPHLAPFELRIVPAGVTIDERALTSELVDARERSRERWQTLTFAVLASAQKSLDPQLSLAFSCFAWQLGELDRSVQHLVDGHASGTPAPAQCTPLPGLPEGITPLADQLRNLQGASAEQLARVSEEFEKQLSNRLSNDKLRQLVDQARAQLASAVAAVATQSHRAEDVLRAELGNVDVLVAHAYATLERARDLAARLRAEAVRVASDRELQVAAFQQSVQVLAEQPSIFDERHENPPLLPGERTLAMQYGDQFQGFVLSPWFGVPFRVRELPGASFQASVAIPLLDLVGLRLQFRENRFADLRCALGVAGFQDLDVKEGGSSSSKDVFNWAAHASIGFGTIKVALGMVLNNREMFEHDAANRLRIIVGADLLKLLTGRNVELL